MIKIKAKCPSTQQEEKTLEAFNSLKPNSNDQVLLKNVKIFIMILLGVRGKHEMERSFSKFERSFTSNKIQRVS